MKISYKILICDDNIRYIERLRQEISKVNFDSQNFYLNVDIGTTPSKCMSCIQENVYDVIILDVCIGSINQDEISNFDVIRSSLKADYYGRELYDLILKHNPTAKIFALSNLPIMQTRTIFNGADLEYFNKNSSQPGYIIKCIKNYFDTEKKRIFNNVFIVYGHNSEMRFSVEDYIKSIQLNSIDLFLQSSGGLHSVFDALNECVNSAECAIVLLSADDIVLDKDDLQIKYRARQNVIFEMGLFAGHLGRDKVIVLYEEHAKFELPSDVSGIFYIPYDPTEKWKGSLKNTLNKIGFIV